MSDATTAAVDQLHMARALRLAERGLFTSQPNPRVGCVIAHGERVVGEGFHVRRGQAHAETHALAQAGAHAAGATAYVTLEPCAHHGSTPPCADALIRAGISRLVAACEDPFPEVAGRGLQRVREAGIQVEVGVLRDAARDLNRGFFSRIERQRPWVRLKLAMSLDGRTALADGRSQWITGGAARADNMRWRARSSALLTGIGTVLADDSRLTVRLDDESERVPPLRVVLDSGLRVPRDAHVLDASAPTLIVCAPESVGRQRLPSAVEVLSCPRHTTGLGLAVVLAELAQRRVNELQVEAGPTLSGALIHAGLVDELLLYVNPSFLGDSGRPLLQLPSLLQLGERRPWRIVDQRSVGDDLRLLLHPTPSASAS